MYQVKIFITNILEKKIINIFLVIPNNKNYIIEQQSNVKI